jgi:guanylate kinase
MKAAKAEHKVSGPMSKAADGKSGCLIVLSGPSGVGKSTVSRQAAQRTGAVLSVSATTRPPRGGEQDGRDYRFVDVLTFKRMIDQGELLEWAQVFGNYYGTPAAPVQATLRAGKTVILTIDVQGGIQVARKRKDAVGILLVPPSQEVLRQRLSGRATEGAEALARRLAKANEELAMARTSGAYVHEVINDDLEAALQRVAAIIQQETRRHDRST